MEDMRRQVTRVLGTREKRERESMYSYQRKVVTVTHTLSIPYQSNNKHKCHLHVSNVSWYLLVFTSHDILHLHLFSVLSVTSHIFLHSLALSIQCHAHIIHFALIWASMSVFWPPMTFYIQWELETSSLLYIINIYYILTTILIINFLSFLMTHIYACYINDHSDFHLWIQLNK